MQLCPYTKPLVIGIQEGVTLLITAPVTLSCVNVTILLILLALW